MICKKLYAEIGKFNLTQGIDMTINEEIKSLMDASVDKDPSIQFQNIETIITKIFSHIKKVYPQSRECIQHSLLQLERIPKKAIVTTMSMAINSVKRIASKFSNKQSTSLNYFNQNIDTVQFDQLLDKISFNKSEIQNITVLNQNVAEKLTLDERKKAVGYCIKSVETLAVRTSWDSKTIQFYTMLLTIMYSICKKDDVMNLLFDWSTNLLDRFNSSSQHQHARDFAESLLMIGHQENLVAEAYFNASRAYTGCGNPLAGLLYLNISLLDLEERKIVQQEFAFDIIWQLLKTMRATHVFKQSFIDDLLLTFKKLNMGDYQTLSIYHTAFSIGLGVGDIATTHKVESFLTEKRELIFKNMNQSAAPWYSLFKIIRQINNTEEFPNIQFMEPIMRDVLIKNGNKDFVDLCEKKGNQEALLMEELVKLESARNPKDFNYASTKALLLAKNVLDNAAKNSNAENFILAMRPKSDFAFVMPEKHLSQTFNTINLTDVDWKQCKIPYGKTESLARLLQAENSDCVIWIGCGNSNIFEMTLIGNMYKINENQSLKNIDPNKLQKEIISKLKFNDTVKDSCGVYIKGPAELQEESNQIYQQMGDYSLSIPNVVNRFFLVKDQIISAIPHQLMIDEQQNRFVGEVYPSANVISTEFFIKSNFNEPLHEGFTKSYWSPLYKENTFQIIKGSLQEVFDKYNFHIDDNEKPSQPLHSDLNIICAHGADNISETEWFYANGSPIIDSDKVVSSGKIIVLFTCHSGSITYNNFDNATHTIIKRYLKMGYSSVIAPMWSLNIKILPIWLEEFMQVIENGSYVVDAVYQANMKVKQKFISPAAWACLHLFGNPYTKIDDRPILQVEEKKET